MMNWHFEVVSKEFLLFYFQMCSLSLCHPLLTLICNHCFFYCCQDWYFIMISNIMSLRRYSNIPTRLAHKLVFDLQMILPIDLLSKCYPFGYCDDLYLNGQTCSKRSFKKYLCNSTLQLNKGLLSYVYRLST